MSLEQCRKAYHEAICRQMLERAAASIADPESATSVQIIRGLLTRLGFPYSPEQTSPESVQPLFASLTRDYLRQAFQFVRYPDPRNWLFTLEQDGIVFDQYEHLSGLASFLAGQPGVRKQLGDYTIAPSILVGWTLVSGRDTSEDTDVPLGSMATHTLLRARKHSDLWPVLHAIISCNWTLRNGRGRHRSADALNLVGRKKGPIPHIALVTAEPLPMRIASIALGTGDLDCVYHFALPELEQAVVEAQNEDQQEMLETLVNGRRLRDISDLPFDLVA